MADRDFETNFILEKNVVNVDAEGAPKPNARSLNCVHATGGFDSLPVGNVVEAKIKLAIDGRVTEREVKKRQAEQVEEAVKCIKDGDGICTDKFCDLCDGLEWNIRGEGKGLLPPKEVEHELERDAVATAIVYHDVVNPELDLDRDVNQVDDELE